MKQHVNERGANAVCAQVTEVACIHAPKTEKRARSHGNQWSDTANQRADGVVCFDGCCTKEKQRAAKDMC